MHYKICLHYFSQGPEIKMLKWPTTLMAFFQNISLKSQSVYDITLIF